MKKTFRYAYKAIQLYYKANGIPAIIIIFARSYDQSIYPLIQVLLLAQVLDSLQKAQPFTSSKFLVLGVLYLSAAIFKVFLTSYSGVKEAYLGIKFENYLDEMICKKLLQLDPARFEEPEFQNLLSQIDGVKGSFQMHMNRATGFIDSFIKFIAATIVLAIVFPIFPVIIIIATIPSYFAWDKMRIKTWPYFVEKRTRLTRITQYIRTLLSSDSTSKESTIFKTGPILLEKIGKERTIYQTEFLKEVTPWIYHITLASIVQLFAFMYTQYLSIQAVLSGVLSIGQFTIFFQQTLQLTFAAEEILNQYSSISARNKYVDKFFEFLNTEKVIHSPHTPQKIPSMPTPPTIEFKNLSFKYPNTERYIFKNFNLTIAPGEKIAFVGENGTGKTTLIKLLLRFYDATEGEIKINGINIKEINLNEWHKFVGALFQDFIKYQFTFEDNIIFGNIEQKPTKKRLQSAIEKSGALGYIDTLPKKYKQTVGKMFDGGIDLSGGQWQKLALARAFYRDAPILILDEPTSAIDAKAEFEIFEKVQSLQKDKTVIIISHRFSTVRNADRIVVLDQGKIIEEGTHQNLIKKNGLYAELFNIQAQGYK